MKRFNIIKTVSVAAFTTTLLFASCTGNFDELNTHPPGAYFMIYVFCICLIFSMVFIDNQLFNFYKFSSVLMVFAQNVVDLL